MEQRRWLTIEEYLRLWNLCLLTPGINLVGLTILLGKKYGGVWGIIVSLAGLLLPSAAITCLLAVLYTHIARSPITRAVVRGVIPATGGIMLVVAINFVRPLIRRGRQAGPLTLVGFAAMICATAVAIIVYNVPAILVLLGAACLGILVFARDARVTGSEKGESAP